MTPALATDVTDLASGQPDPNLLPPLQWRGQQGGPAAAPEAFVLPGLLELARQRFLADGVPCEAMTVAAGGLDAIHRVLSAQLRLGDPVAMEDPGWGNVLDLVAALGFRPVPIAMDADGVRPELLQDALRAGARAVVITNRAQNPTGVSLTPHRAAELRSVLAGSPGTLVIEDDHAAELAGDPLGSVAGATQSWAFVRSTSKPYGPDLRVAVLAGDPATISRVETRMRISSGWVSTILQRSVVELWTSTEAAASVVAAGRAYDSRRGQLIAALAAQGIPASGQAGLNVWIPVADETTAVASLMQARWAVAPGSRFRQSSPPGIRVTVSGLDANTIPLLAVDIATAIAGYSAARYST